MKSSDSRFSPSTPAIEARIDSLIAKLTLEEKIGLLGGHPKQGSMQGNQTIGLPELKMADGPLGIHWWCESSTAYPASISAAATWNCELMHELGESIGRDARARGIHVLLAPGVNIYRSALCGRNFEYLGEDPYLSSRMVTEEIKGIQSQGVAATVKHYAVNFQEYDRHGVSSDIDERTLHEVYLPAFKAAILEAGVACVMTAYNLVNSVHCSEHDYLINSVLKGDWKFDGLVMSDWISVYSALGAATGGLDLEMPTAKWLDREHLLPLVKNGMLSEKIIDDKVRRMLRLAICFGWLENEQIDSTIPQLDTRSHATALQLAREGTVLLKNQNELLPLNRENIKSIAVVGSIAKRTPTSGGGSALCPPNHQVSILDGIRSAAGESIAVNYCSGTDYERCLDVFCASEFLSPTGTPGLLGEYFDNGTIDSNPTFTRIDPVLSFNWKEKSYTDGGPLQGFAVRWSGSIIPRESGNHTFYLWGPMKGWCFTLNGTPYTAHYMGENHYHSELTTIMLEAGKTYSLELTYVKTNPWESIHFGYEPRSVIERGLEQTLSYVKAADVVVFTAGFTAASEMEGRDRSFSLPATQLDLLGKVAALNPSIVAVVCAGGNAEMLSWINSVKSLLWAWFPGQEGGAAIGEILFGQVNPSGHLPATFEKRLEDRSSYDCYHDTDSDKRVTLTDGIFGGYHHFDKTGIEPLFPFGFGLSYTTFKLSNLLLSSPRITENETVSVSVEIANTGKQAGAQVVQMYLRDLESSLPRPIKELKGFSKIFLEPGASGKVTMTIDRASLAYYDPDRHTWVYEKGDFIVQIGASAADIQLQQLLTAR